jgi:hypothetical protein
MGPRRVYCRLPPVAVRLLRQCPATRRPTAVESVPSLHRRYFTAQETFYRWSSLSLLGSPNLNSNIKHCAALPPPLPHSVIKLSNVVISFSTFCRCSHPELNHPTLNPILTTGFFGPCLVTRRTFISSVFKYSRHEHNYNWLQISPWLKVLLRSHELAAQLEKLATAAMHG